MFLYVDALYAAGSVLQIKKYAQTDTNNVNNISIILLYMFQVYIASHFFSNCG
jgi:hypothetical protein